ncbi:MAG: hypothetical protein PHG16_12295 [Lachnospiraceae bacterium]|nr:hypothetical protein [Lachnospiraceae bacterium]
MKIKNKKKIILRTVAILLLLAAGTGIYLGYVYVVRMKFEPPTSLTETNTNAAIYQLNELKDVLAQFDDFYTTAERNNLKNTKDYGTYIIPGMKATKGIELESGKVDMCTSMTPQSIAVTSDYLIVSAYCHTKKHSSVLYVIDKVSHEYVKTVVLPGHSHVGGLAYDSDTHTIWVSGRKAGVSYANSYSLEAIEDYSLDEAQSPLSFMQMVPLIQLKQNSFMTYRDHALYAGYFSQSGEGVLYKYTLGADGRLESSKPVESVDKAQITNDDSEKMKEKAAEEAASSASTSLLSESTSLSSSSSDSVKAKSKAADSSLADSSLKDSSATGSSSATGTLADSSEKKKEEEEVAPEDTFDPVDFVNMPSLVQGISFLGSNYLLAAESYGMMESKLRVFENDSSSTDGYSFTDENALVSYTLPDKLECACVADGKVYLVFEASAYAYRVRPMYNIDRILTLNINQDIAESRQLIQ